jgi:predicted dehydrogenase
VSPKKVAWGVISTAKIGSGGCSRDEEEPVGRFAGRRLARRREGAHVRRRDGHPEALRQLRGVARRSEIEAIYNPLPNHLHVPMTLAAARAGKHVLCEKPVAMTADEAAQLRDAAAAC